MRGIRRTIGALLLPLLLAAGGSAGAQSPPETPESTVPGPSDRDPLFAGWQTEPAMEYGGMTLATAQRALGAFAFPENHPAVAAAWEFPAGILLSVVQHEFFGHGGRAREFDLDPSYGFGLDLSAYTTINRDPESVDQIVDLAAAGTEADTVLAHRLLEDLYRPHGAEGATVPLLLAAKLDLSLYVWLTPRPDPPDPDDEESFVDAFEDGNDIAIWLVARQGKRTGADPVDLWNGDIEIDYHDPLLLENWDAARAAAIWNVLDPSLVMAVWSYFQDRLFDGATRLQPLALKLADGYSLTAGTRATIGPAEVSRYLDLYLRTPHGLILVYVRDLDSSVERTYGAGLTLHGLRLGARGELSVGGDWWTPPDSAEYGSRADGYNVVGDVSLRVAGRWGLAAKVGYKKSGFFPGLPLEEGAYFGLGLTARY